MTRLEARPASGVDLFENVVSHYARDLDGLRFGLVSGAADPRELVHLIVLLVEAGARIRLYDPEQRITGVDDPRITLAENILDAAHKVDGLIVPDGWRTTTLADRRRIAVLMRQKVWFDGCGHDAPTELTDLGLTWLAPPTQRLGRAEAAPAQPMVPSLPRWRVAHGLPVPGVPADFPIPPVRGEGNDYGFLEAGFHARSDRVSVAVVSDGDTAALTRTLTAIAAQARATEGLEVIACLPPGVVLPASRRPPDRIVVAAEPAARIDAGVAAATADVVAVMAAGSTPAPDVLAKLVARAAATPQVVAFGARRADCLARIEANDGARRDRQPCRAVDGTVIAAQRATWEAVGPFAPEGHDHRSLCIEWTRRAHDAGYYLVPVRAELGDPPADRPLDAPFLDDFCPLAFRTYSPGRVYRVPRVSVYIPAWNVAAYLGEAIDSVLDQDYTDVEVCVVDDGSTDHTAELLARRYDGHPRVRWVSQENQGISGASNRAIGLCRGPYIGQLDGDDTLVPHAVRTLAGHLDAHRVGYVYSANDKVDRACRYLRPGYEWPVFCRTKLFVSNIAHHFRMFRRRAWMRTAGYDTTLENAIDYDMALKLAEVCTLAHVPEVLYLYRWHGANTSIVNRELQFRNQLRAMERALERMGLADTWAVHPPRSGTKPDGSYRRIAPRTENAS